MAHKVYLAQIVRNKCWNSLLIYQLSVTNIVAKISEILKLTIQWSKKALSAVTASLREEG